MGVHVPQKEGAVLGDFWHLRPIGLNGQISRQLGPDESRPLVCPMPFEYGTLTWQVELSRYKDDNYYY